MGAPTQVFAVLGAQLQVPEALCALPWGVHTAGLPSNRYTTIMKAPLTLVVTPPGQGPGPTGSEDGAWSGMESARSLFLFTQLPWT